MTKPEILKHLEDNLTKPVVLEISYCKGHVIDVFCGQLYRMEQGSPFKGMFAVTPPHPFNFALKLFRLNCVDSVRIDTGAEGEKRLIISVSADKFVIETLNN